MHPTIKKKKKIIKQVSFDFDNTLSRESIQKYAKELIDRGLEVWIVTSRYDEENLYKYNNPMWDHTDLYKVADKLEIPSNRIQFMNMIDKYNFFLNKDFIWHLDDDASELSMINSFTKTRGISCYRSTSWKYKCENLLKEKPA